MARAAAKTGSRKTARRSGKPVRGGGQGTGGHAKGFAKEFAKGFGKNFSKNFSKNFCAATREALKRGEPDAIPDKALQDVLTAAVKLYAAKVERRGHDVAPYAPHSVTATETVVTACGLIRAADLNMFDVAIWFHRPPGIE